MLKPLSTDGLAVSLRSRLKVFLRSHRPRRTSLPYWAAGGAALLTAQTWFRPGRHTAAGDVLPFIRDSLSSEIFDLWNHQLTAAGGVSAEIVRLFDVAFIQLFDVVGLGPHVAQRAYFTFLALLAALATTRLVSVLASVFTPHDPHDPHDLKEPSTGVLAASAAAGVLAVLNPYWMVLIPNPIFLAVIGIGALTAAAVWRAALGHPPALTNLVLGSLPLVILGTNPPLLAVWAVWTLLNAGTAWWVLHAHPSRSTGPLFWKSLLRGLAVTAAVSAFWVVPLFLTLTAPTTSVAAQVSPEAWSWSHAQNTVANVAGLNAFWGWPYDDTYLPFTSRLDEPWWAMMRFALPLAALFALGYGLFQRSSATLRRLSAAMAATGVGALVLGKGLHPPFVGLNQWLYDHLPGMWLLREPMSKVGWVLLLVYLISIVSALTHLLHRHPAPAAARPPLKPNVSLLAAAATLVLGSALAYVHPLYTGEAVPASREKLPGAYVALPADLSALARAVDTTASGRVLTLPHSTFYQMGHSWGYYGVDQVYTQAFASPTISLSSGGYFGQDPNFVAFSEAVESRLLAGDVAGARRLMGRLGADTLVLRFDYDPSVSQTGLADPRLLDEVLRSSGLSPVYSSTLAVVYHLPAPPPIKAVSATEVASLPAASPQEWVAAASLLDPGTVLVSDLFDSAPTSAVIGSHPLPLPVSVSEVVLATPELAGFTVNHLGELSPSASVVLDNTALPLADPASASGGLPVAALRVGEFSVAVGEEVSFLARPGSLVELFSVSADSRPLTGAHSCDRRTSVFCLPLDRSLIPSSASDVLLSVSSTEDRRSPVSVCLRVVGGSGCLRHASLLPHPGEAEATLAPATLVLSRADLAAVLELTISGQDLSADGFEVVATPLRLAGTQAATLPQRLDLAEVSGQPSISFRQDAPRLPEVLQAEVFSELEDCDRSDSADPELGFIGAGSELRLSARRHSACVWANLGTPAAPSLRVSFEYETISGRAARFCLWQTALSRCAPAPALEGSAGLLDAVVDLETNEGSVLFFVYADAPSSALNISTEVAYRDIRVTPLPGLTALALTSPGSNNTPPPLSVDTSGRLPLADVEAALPADTLVTLSEAFSPDLVLYADGRRLDTLPVKVDGWSQGWLLTEPLPSGARLSIGHRLEPAADAALGLSAVMLLLALAGTGRKVVIKVVGVFRRPRPADSPEK